jgi:hypothetical protein
MLGIYDCSDLFLQIKLMQRKKENLGTVIAHR